MAIFSGRRAGFAAIMMLGLLAPASAATFSTIYTFCAGGTCTSDEGSKPAAGVIVDSSGNIYGTTQLAGTNGYGTVFKLTPNVGGGYTRTTLYSFCSTTPITCTDGGQPQAGLIMDVHGNLYGTTARYGHASSGYYGTAFRLHPTAGGTYNYKVIYTFCSLTSCADGAKPVAGLTYAGASTGALYDGNSPLYGTTEVGGSAGSGTVFELDPPPTGTNFSETVLFSFCVSTCTDGVNPTAGVVVDGSGNLFGVAGWGAHGDGIVYELAKSGASWNESVVYNFCSDPGTLPVCHDGKSPGANLLIDSTSGDIYGTASVGGDAYTLTTDGAGVVYRLHNPNGCMTGAIVQWCQERLYSFCALTNCADGYWPSDGFALYQDSAGHLWGTSELGGANSFSNGGVVFKLTGVHLNNYHVMYSFCATSGCADGSDLHGGLSADSSGNLYGTTYSGGNSFNNGTVFKVVP